MDVIVPVCEQRLWQLPQEGLQQGGSIVGVEPARLQVYVCPRIQHLPEGGLPQAVAWHTEQPLHMEVCQGRVCVCECEKVCVWVGGQAEGAEDTKTEWGEPSAAGAKCSEMNY